MSELKRIDYISEPVRSLNGSMKVPGDKSVSHRSIIFGAIADGQTRVTAFLDSADTIATAEVFREMGVRIDRSADTLTVHGVGLYGLKPPSRPLYFGNSGTSVRLLSGLLAGQQFDSELIGDESLMQRPMRRVVLPLREMGADLDCTEAGTLPLHIRGGRKLKGINYRMPVASAQLKSCLLLAGLYAEGNTTIIEPAVTRDHTERMLPGFGRELSRSGNSVTLRPGRLTATEVNVPGDISSAAFFLVAASICPGSDIVLENIGINPTRHAVIEILQMMGADIQVETVNSASGTEPTASIHVKYRPLSGIEIPSRLVPIAIDEIPAILIAAASAKGDTILRDAAELRVKESDRIEAMSDGLTRLGIINVTTPDGIVVTGGKLQGGTVDSYGDHRIAMAFAVSALIADGPVRITDCINVNTSFPGFASTANSVGMKVTVIEQTDV
jgi:3-phosphoshikimate 1-carboxyvinyltransferase